MDTQQELTVEQRLLKHAEQQTRSLSGLYTLGIVWTLLAVIGLVILIAVLANS